MYLSKWISSQELLHWYVYRCWGKSKDGLQHKLQKYRFHCGLYTRIIWLRRQPQLSTSSISMIAQISRFFILDRSKRNNGQECSQRRRCPVLHSNTKHSRQYKADHKHFQFRIWPIRARKMQTTEQYLSRSPSSLDAPDDGLWKTNFSDFSQFDCFSLLRWGLLHFAFLIRFYINFSYIIWK